MLHRGIERRRGGRFRVRLSAEERRVLSALPGQLREALAKGDPSLYRLFPPAFDDDDAANEDYAQLVGQGLVEGKLLALGELERTAHAEMLSEADLEAWLGALESLRLALGTQLDITEESYLAFDESAPDAQRLALYHWLSWLQEEVVQALSSAS